MFERTEEERQQSEKAGHVFAIVAIVFLIAIALAAQIWWLAVAIGFAGGSVAYESIKTLRAMRKAKSRD